MAVGEPSNKYQHDQYISTMYKQFKAWEVKIREYAKRMGDSDRSDAYLAEIGYDDTVQDPDGFNMTDVEKVRAAIAGLLLICDAGTGEAAVPAETDMTYWPRRFSTGMNL